MPFQDVGQVNFPEQRAEVFFFFFGRLMAQDERKPAVVKIIFPCTLFAPGILRDEFAVTERMNADFGPPAAEFGDNV